jgi:hypothetical protein
MLLPLFHSAAGTHRAAKCARKPQIRGIESLGSLWFGHLGASAVRRIARGAAPGSMSAAPPGLSASRLVAPYSHT